MRHKAVWLSCDGCGVADTHEQRRQTVREARRAAAADGWKRENGQDLCPPCSLLSPEQREQWRERMAVPPAPPTTAADLARHGIEVRRA